MLARTRVFAYGLIWCTSAQLGACTPEALIGIDQRGPSHDSGSMSEAASGGASLGGTPSASAGATASAGAPARQCLESDVIHQEHPEIPIVVCCDPLPDEIAWARDALFALNSARQGAGLSPLSWDEELLQTAIALSLDWVLHDGDGPDIRYLNRDSAVCARNVRNARHMDARAAWEGGRFSPDVVSGWLNDPGSKAVLLSDLSAAGVAHTRGLVVGVFR